MKNRQYLLKQLLLLWLLSLVPGLSVFQARAQQEVLDAINKINAAYLSLNSYSASFEYLLYEGSQRNNSIEKESGVYYRMGDASYMNCLGVENIINSSFNVSVYHEERMMLVGMTAAAKRLPLADLLAQLKVDTLWDLYERVNFSQIDKKRAACTFYLKKGRELRSIKITYSTKTYLLEEVLMEFSDDFKLDGGITVKNPQLLLRYYNVKLNGRIPAKHFSEKRFFTRQNGKIQLSPAFQNYQLVKN